MLILGNTADTKYLCFKSISKPLSKKDPKKNVSMQHHETNSCVEYLKNSANTS